MVAWRSLQSAFALRPAASAGSHSLEALLKCARGVVESQMLQREWIPVLVPAASPTVIPNYIPSFRPLRPKNQNPPQTLSINFPPGYPVSAADVPAASPAAVLADDWGVAAADDWSAPGCLHCRWDFWL